jgi:SAM-dependent methyltransferase
MGLFLDAGCGDSPDALLAVRYLGFKSAIKVDLYPIKQANRFVERDLAKAEGKTGRFIQSDVCDMTGQVEDSSVSLIGCNAMIDLIEPEARPLFYAEAWRVLKPGGLLAISYIPLAAGYGWGDGWAEIAAMRAKGFEQVNRGHYNLIIVRKPLQLLNQAHPEY